MALNNTGLKIKDCRDQLITSGTDNKPVKREYAQLGKDSSNDESENGSSVSGGEDDKDDENKKGVGESAERGGWVRLG